MFKSAEEKEAERREREERSAREEAARAEQARLAKEQQQRKTFLATPVGAATAAKESGQAFFEIQLEVGGHKGDAWWGEANGQRTAASSQRVFLSGEATAVSGVTVGVYLFRNTDSQPAPVV